MKSKPAVCMQIGKNGLNEGIFHFLENAFKERGNVKICVLKSGGHEKENVEKIAEGIISRLGNNFTYRIVGFTIFLKKWRKIMRR